MEKCCCATGHRKLPEGKVDYIKKELQEQIQFAVNDGYTHFISGMADGVDLYFAEIVAKIKAKIPEVTLEAAIPNRNRLETKNPMFQKLIKLCDSIHVTAETYSKGSYLKRNMYMVGKCKRVIAVYDGREGDGTDFTIRHAKTKRCELRIIEIE